MTITVRLIEAQRIKDLINLRAVFGDDSKTIVGYGNDLDEARGNIINHFTQLHGTETEVRFCYATSYARESD